MDLIRYFSFLFFILPCLFLQSCDHLLGKSWHLGYVVCDCSLCFFVTFPYGVLGQVLYLIVLIPDLCLLSFFV